MKKVLLGICVLGMCGVALADGPQMSYGPAGDSPTYVQREDVCQYGFTDMWAGSGYTLGLGQQLGISCAGPMTIIRVGFYCEFIATAGTCDIVIRDNGVEVSRTPVQPVAGNNEFDIVDTPVSGTACIMLCGVGSFWAVTGEDPSAPIDGMTYWSTSCECTTAFTDQDLTIWAVSEGGVPAEPTTWGSLQNLFR
jgi:hypothetical protein